ncbi:MAG: FkbM family methyltransferase [Hyphomicrobiales bacterium]|nr:FkbM family methyltransferase [Hyphomicrobiales bacterium]MCP4999640.1 FkbM family methyltransferase [Hyphomicrobiales bacterium]
MKGEKGKVFNKFLFFVERVSAYLQGKGWGSGTVEKEFAAAVSLLTRKNPQTCIDIGGNKGTYTQEIMRKFPNCSVVMFEPAKSNVDILKQKFRANSNVVIEQTAVSNEVGDATLFSNEDGSGLASLTKRRLDHFGIDFNNTESIRTVKFEDYWKERLGSKKIDICKIDIEGHELDALAGFGDALNSIEVIQFEFGGCNIDTRTFFQDFWYFFEENGFDLYRITPFGVVHIPKYRELDEFFSTTNYLAKRKA